MPLKTISSKTGWVVATCIACLAITACENREIHSYQALAFGTIVEIRIHDADKAVAERASRVVFTHFDEIHDKWHAWEPGELMQANQAFAEGRSYNADTDLLELLQLSKRYSIDSMNLFNPAIGRLIALWGFQSSDLPTAPPRQREVSELLNHLPTMHDLTINDSTISSRSPELQLDLGAIAKGYAVYLGTRDLQQKGIDNALVNAGGDLCAIGSHGQRPWQIGIRDPGDKGVVGSIALADGECVFTSGNYERFFTFEGKHYHHIIDPRTGFPADKVVSVTVLDDNAALADAASTALFIAGPDKLADVASALGVNAIMMIDNEDRIYMTPAMKNRITLEDTDRNGEILTVQLTGKMTNED